jgi:hypothetical protein
MLAKPIWSQIVGDDALTRGLGDPEARMLIEWLVEQAERFSEHIVSENDLYVRVAALCRKARGLGRFVRLWCYEGGRRGACQLAAVERFPWPLPTRDVDPCTLMEEILSWEERALRAAV